MSGADQSTRAEPPRPVQPLPLWTWLLSLAVLVAAIAALASIL